MVRLVLLALRPVYGAEIQTHNLSVMGPLPKPQGRFRLLKINFFISVFRMFVHHGGDRRLPETFEPSAWQRTD